MALYDRQEPYLHEAYSFIAVDKQNKKTNKKISSNLSIKMKPKLDKGDR